MSDLYSRIFAPLLPEAWVKALGPLTVYLDALTPWIIAAVVSWAILYTYYEVEKQVTRDPSVPARLREFYTKSDSLIRYDIKDETELAERIEACRSWKRELGGWVKENMTEAALSRLRDTSNMLPFRNSNAINKEHNTCVNTINKARDNLKDLINSDAWDKPR